MGVETQTRRRALKAADRGLILGNMGPGSGYIKQASRKLEAALQDAVVDAGQELTVDRLATIQTACRAERAALWAQKYLRTEGKGWTPETRLAYMKALVRFSQNRDQCIRELALPKTEADAFELEIAALYRQPALPPANDNGDGTLAAGGDASQPESDGNGQHVDQAGDATAASTASEGGHTA